MILWCIQIHFYIIYVLFNAELLLWVFCKRNKLNGMMLVCLCICLLAWRAHYSAHFWFPLYDPRHYTLFFLSSCPSLNSFTSHMYTRICPAGSSHSLRPSPHCSLSSRWSHHRVEMLSNLKRGRGLSRLSRFSLCCVSSRFKDSDLNVGRRYLIFFLNCRMNTWTLLL